MYNNKWIKKYVEENNYKDILNYNPKNNNCLAIIVETRNLPIIDWVCDTVKYHLNWPIRFYCSHSSKNIVNDVEKSIIPQNINLFGNILKT